MPCTVLAVCSHTCHGIKCHITLIHFLQSILRETLRTERLDLEDELFPWTETCCMWERKNERKKERQKKRRKERNLWEASISQCPVKINTIKDSPSNAACHDLQPAAYIHLMLKPFWKTYLRMNKLSGELSCGMDKQRMERHLRFLACFYPLNTWYDYTVSWTTSSKAVWFRCIGPTPNFPRFPL